MHKNMRQFLNCSSITGKRIISFHEIGWNSEHDGLECGADEWRIAQRVKPGEFGWPIGKKGIGKIGGGSKNLQCFFDWVMNTGGYCFNPINIDDFVWSRLNNAFMRKSEPFIQCVPIEIKARYIFCREGTRRGDLIKLVKKNHRVFAEDEVVWEK